MEQWTVLCNFKSAIPVPAFPQIVWTAYSSLSVRLILP